MKSSRYNFLSQTDKGEKLIFNALSGALATIDEVHLRELSLIEGNEEKKSTLSEEERINIYQPLLKGGFIYPDDFPDELDLISFNYDRGKYASEYMNLTIAPTMDCNFNCYYCYEKWRNAKAGFPMSEETENAVIKFIDFNMVNKKYLSVTWYGGEPLLALDNIWRLSLAFLDICKRRNCEYSAAIVTNGYFLDKKAVDGLVRLKVKSAQVTIDGLKEVHDSRRFDVKNGPSFDVIMRNIEYAKKYMDIVIRMNVDRQNIDDIESFLNYLKERVLDDNCGVYMGRVLDCSDALISRDTRLLLDSAEYLIKEKEIMTKVIDNQKIKHFGSYPAPLVLPCGSININTFSIDPRGYVYKCWELLGVEANAIFHISKPELLNNRNKKWIDWDPKDDEECRICKFLPLCNGGCVLRAMDGKKSCSYWKENLQDMLGILAYKYEFIAGRGGK